MKNLNEYETPISDENSCNIIGFHSCATVPTFTTRDLERKLSMCRDALSEIAAFRTMKSHDAGAVISEDARDVATEALDQTK